MFRNFPNMHAKKFINSQLWGNFSCKFFIKSKEGKMFI